MASKLLMFAWCAYLRACFNHMLSRLGTEQFRPQQLKHAVGAINKDASRGFLVQVVLMVSLEERVLRLAGNELHDSTRLVIKVTLRAVLP